MRERRSVFLLGLALITLSANSFFLVRLSWLFIPALIVMFFTVNVIPSLSVADDMGTRIRLCWHGVSVLKLFEYVLPISLLIHIILAVVWIPENWGLLLWSMLYCYLVLNFFFWNGMIFMYLCSVQLGVKQRVLGLVCGMIPVLNLVMLDRMLKYTTIEVRFETEKRALNKSREGKNICKTKYPLFMVHGIFFRDSERLNYWGRVPAELEKNGATIYYGNHHSASSVEESAFELAERVKNIIRETGCEKLNVIAHSKGGLDMRYALKNCGISQYVASMVTVNTPHRGCRFADYLLEKAPVKVRDSVANAYNATFRKLGDTDPDFLKAARDLTSEVCIKRDGELSVPEDIYTCSIGSKLKKATNGKFPLNITYPLVNLFDGANDGLVGEDSFKWGDNYIFLEPRGSRGISHGDMIDLNRENIEGFDVREFYVGLVSDLRKRGL